MRRKFSWTRCGYFLLALAPFRAAAQQDFSKVEIETEKLAEGVYSWVQLVYADLSGKK